MVITVDLQADRGLTQGDLMGLWSYLQQLIGKPFLFLRFSYADELTLHLGTQLAPLSPKLKELRGSYVLTMRGSDWWLLSGQRGTLTLSGPEQLGLPKASLPTSEQEVASFASVSPGAFVVRADPFSDPSSGGFGLLVTFSDGSIMHVRPTATGALEPGDDDLPEIADWELFTPYGRYLRVGPGPQWAYEPSGDTTSAADNTEPQPGQQTG
jgi:hypothetical protein